MREGERVLFGGKFAERKSFAVVVIDGWRFSKIGFKAVESKTRR